MAEVRFPQTYEQYLATREPGHSEPNRDRCTGCLKGGEPVTPDGYCHECLRYHFGYDQAEYTMLRAMLAGALRGAFETSIDPALVRRVVDDVFADLYFERGREEGRYDERTVSVPNLTATLEASLAAATGTREEGTA